MLFEGRPFTQPLEPVLQIFQRRSLDRERMPAINQSAERDLRQAEFLAGKVGTVFELVVGDGPGRQRLATGHFDGAMVALLRSRADEAEQQCSPRRTDTG